MNNHWIIARFLRGKDEQEAKATFLRWANSQDMRIEEKETNLHFDIIKVWCCRMNQVIGRVRFKNAVIDYGEN